MSSLPVLPSYQDALLNPRLLHFVINEYLTPASPPSGPTSTSKKPSKDVPNKERIAASQVAMAVDMVTRHQLLRERATGPEVTTRPSGTKVAQDAWCRRVGELVGSQQVGGDFHGRKVCTEFTILNVVSSVIHHTY